MPTLLTVAPYRVWPPVSGAALLIDGASRAVAARGWTVRLFTTGVRRGSLWSDLRPVDHEPAPGYHVHNHASLWSLLLTWRSRQATGLPPLGADRVLASPPPLLRRWVDEADVVQVEGPFGYAAVRRLAGRRVPLVLVCHNVEGRLARGAPADRIRALEAAAVRDADAVIALTGADRDALEADYGPAPGRLHVVPCGVDLERFRPVAPEAREAAKARLGLQGRTVAVFTGARYGPNVEAVRHLERMAASGALPPGLAFLVVGRVGEAVRAREGLVVTGFVPDVGPVLAAADLAVVPMESGGGMHLKVLEFLALGLPVVATPLALRGLEAPLPEGVVAAPPEGMPGPIAARAGDPERREREGRANREWVADRYGWERVAGRRLAVYDRLRADAPRA